MTKTNAIKKLESNGFNVQEELNGKIYAIKDGIKRAIAFYVQNEKVICVRLESLVMDNTIPFENISQAIKYATTC